MKKRYITIPLLIAVILFMTWKIPDKIYPIPVLPAVATEIGQYNLDNHRAVEIRTEDGSIRYYEVTTEGGFVPDEESGMVSYSLNHIEDIKLVEGWSISLEKPSTIVIKTGEGETIRREFGQLAIREKVKVQRSEMTREQMVERFNEVIAGEPQAVPIDEVSPTE